MVMYADVRGDSRHQNCQISPMKAVQGSARPDLKQIVEEKDLWLSDPAA
jgi:hypothetical protein